jgi:hypothetical protein
MTRLFAFTGHDYTKFDYMHKSPARGPQWTFVELARRWNLSVPQLAYLMQHYPGFPDASMRRTGTTGAHRYYDLHKAQTWHNAHKGNVLALQQKAVL